MEKQNLKFTGRGKELVKQLMDTLWRVKSQVLNKKEDIIVKDKVVVYDGRQSISLSGTHQEIADKIETILQNTPAELIEQNSFKTRSMSLNKDSAPTRPVTMSSQPINLAASVHTKPIAVTETKPVVKQPAATHPTPGATTTQQSVKDTEASLNAEANLKVLMTMLNDIHPEIANAITIADKVNAVRTILARKPGVKPAGVKSEMDRNPTVDGVDWDRLNSLPHMRDA